MSSIANSSASLRPNQFKWQIGLWAAQILLAVFYGFAGTLKTFMPPDALPAMGLNYATQIPFLLLRFIGICELAGTIGILLPALTRIKPSLTPLAALGFVAIQILAIAFHIYRGEIEVLPMNMIALAIAAFVVWGRTRKLPITPRA
ncbi:DoxX family protein [Martelella radicis]|uniref:Putative membrane protein YphA (DoxX/SURF4 family) n=1 Tax=Martelella radicis TaxID=1397476 RepID=A0A7W6KLR8_9HYPH|nr:DoxX family protein [Martelella radicis]MBB4123568.1 putative membrane protein YphA (DoxX/SURF4 family) [Martelella radicis]